MLGIAYWYLGDREKSKVYYRQALPVYQELGNDVAGTLNLVEAILSYLATGSIYGILSPFGAYLACFQALQVADDPRAENVLTEARRLLRETAVMIENPSLRTSYLQNVPAHRKLMAF
jgi:hypothetical protein